MPFKDKEVKKAYTKKHNKAKAEHYREKRRQTTYGITPEEFAVFVDECGICGTDKKLVLDHNHETGKMRGKLCRKHNMGLGLFGDSVKGLEQAIEYLKNAES